MYKLLREILKELKDVNETLREIAYPVYPNKPKWMQERMKEREIAQEEARKRSEERRRAK